VNPFEKLGAFYLGKEYDLSAGRLLDQLVMYDARDLTTHGVCVGMTGSGKTGLCIDLLEEAAIDNVPAIIVDPKGDITNLLLTFPELRPQDFEPWVNIDDARRKDMSVPDYARKTADNWRQGLADWGQGPDRIRMLKESTEFRIYTPGSDAGLPVSILASLRAPVLDWDTNQEVLREQIQGTVSALLGIVGIDADPLKSREHILLANVFEHYWRQGEDLDLARLITSIQSPPVRKLGVFDIDTFFPEKDRFALSMSLNNIMAAPSFSAWIEGEPLEIPNLLYTASGKPRHSIFYIAHLSDAERMFFVTLLLEKIVTWVRQQSGTTSLRALLYFDEIFGFFPPTANPPSKKPLLTLLKQARAFGLGVILTTQNPVDIDYKGLSNAGTWFIGKLQTDQDKARLLDGLQAASTQAGKAPDRSELERIISGLGSRVFMLHNIHEGAPVIFQTRWAMSYLRGPLTRPQVSNLMAGAETTPPVSAAAPGSESGTAARGGAGERIPAPVLEGYSATPPSLPPGLPVAYLPVRTSAGGALTSLEGALGRAVTSTGSTLVYEPQLVTLGQVQFISKKLSIDESRRVDLLVPPTHLEGVVRWQEADTIEIDQGELGQRPETGALFGIVPSQLNTAADLKSLKKSFSDYLYRDQKLSLYYNPELKLYGKPGEEERDFKARAQQAVREKRDDEVEAMRKKYEKKLDRLEVRLSREERELSEDEAEHAARKREEVFSIGETVVGMLGMFGRRRRSLSGAVTKRRMTARAKADVKESEAEIARIKEEVEALEQEMQHEADTITEKWEGIPDKIETYPVKPRRQDVRVDLVALTWVPAWEIGTLSATGTPSHHRMPAWHA
jgi:hypothetical protein